VEAVYRDLKDRGAAIEQLNVVLENDSRYSRAHLLLGVICRTQGRDKEARRYIQSYINMEPDAKSAEEFRNWLKSSSP